MIDCVFFVPFLGVGGSEKVLVSLANELAKRGYKIQFCILKKGGALEDEIDEKVSIVYLYSDRTIYSIFKIAKFLSEVKAKVYFSSLWHMNLVLGIAKCLSKSPARFIARETNLLSEKSVTGLKKIITRFIYNIFDTVVAQSEDMRSDLINNYGVLEDTVCKINNGANQKLILELSKALDVNFDTNLINLVTVGKLEYQKGYQELLRLYSRSSFIEKCKLHIIGDGSLKNDINKQIKTLGIEDRVILYGNQRNPYPFIANADAFISSSHFEGFPNVLIEALACRTFIVSNRYKGGVNEIINDDCGIFFDLSSLESFDEALGAINNMKSKKHQLKPDYRYSLDAMVDSYEELFNKKKIEKRC
ncbi:glycosyltransferase [Parendozoicomonas haliclonae]|uniref:N-acetylgalactosamine-N, N'-diacetylbacillosaminyl-diphospho-undecaprenol 4-alpha-N-acetylgalactosaminyltransferase n=1 Tax=Parendozoicomonas haliclonae TaxID=1960125 RepID=A0A1X7ATY9_9GAMM|nr:glycosyltransferase [Parendozoicomonas haliclonae]SMA50887.1 N-acetylgalactosamine-N, N'-diacetylbacillosaminyl-diphospho-undecaprenol 4-alpha-N-acetylgalactosaminyltransferase [Parendozoicomonas haliclonae]